MYETRTRFCVVTGHYVTHILTLHKFFDELDSIRVQPLVTDFYRFRIEALLLEIFTVKLVGGRGFEPRIQTT